MNLAILKLDYKNAFSFIWRDRILEVVQHLAFDIYPLLILLLFVFSFLGRGDKLLQSSECV